MTTPLNELKTRDGDRQKVNAFLDRINENDQATRDEVIAHCSADKEARAYYVRRYMEDK